MTPPASRPPETPPPDTRAHEDVLDDLPALLTGELTPAREREVAEHLDGCDPCRRDLAVVARASAWLQDAARLGAFPAAAFPAAGADEEPLELPPLQLPRHRHRGRWLAAAASVVLLAGSVLGGGGIGP